MPPRFFERRGSADAFAKVNLGLTVLGPRPDGYHDIRTCFQAIDLSDEVTVFARRSRRSTVTLECDAKDLESPDNLACRAARAFLSRCRIRVAVHVSLRKRIPAGGGLGGASSDAAAVLRLLEGLLPGSVKMPELFEIAASLGSDVPFFLLGGTALASGRGTEVQAIGDLPHAAITLVMPQFRVSTAEAYRALAESRASGLTSPGDATRMESVASEPEAFAYDCLADWMRNDFEPVVFPRFPQLEDIKRKLLLAGARHALMSGTGSTVFGMFDSNPAARDAARSLSTEGLRVECSRFLGRAECFARR